MQGEGSCWFNVQCSEVGFGNAKIWRMSFCSVTKAMAAENTVQRSNNYVLKVFKPLRMRLVSKWMCCSILKMSKCFHFPPSFLLENIYQVWSNFWILVLGYIRGQKNEKYPLFLCKFTEWIINHIYTKLLLCIQHFFPRKSHDMLQVTHQTLPSRNFC